MRMRIRDLKSFLVIFIWTNIKMYGDSSILDFASFDIRRINNVSFFDIWLFFFSFLWIDTFRLWIEIFIFSISEKEEFLFFLLIIRWYNWFINLQQFLKFICAWRTERVITRMDIRASRRYNVSFYLQIRDKNRFVMYSPLR